jgi:hypothetical protein
MHPLATFIQILAGLAIAIALVATVAVLLRGSEEGDSQPSEHHH